MVQHIEMPFAPYNRAMLDVRALSLSVAAKLLVLIYEQHCQSLINMLSVGMS